MSVKRCTVAQKQRPQCRGYNLKHFMSFMCAGVEVLVYSMWSKQSDHVTVKTLKKLTWKECPDGVSANRKYSIYKNTAKKKKQVMEGDALS